MKTIFLKEENIKINILEEENTKINIMEENIVQNFKGSPLDANIKASVEEVNEDDDNNVKRKDLHTIPTIFTHLIIVTTGGSVPFFTENQTPIMPNNIYCQPKHQVRQTKHQVR